MPDDVDISEMSNGKLNGIGAIFSICQSRIAVREDSSCERLVAPFVFRSDQLCTTLTKVV